MQKYITIIFTLLLSALTCSGQSFLAKYPKLTDKDLSAFFEDWKAYSDSISSNITISNPLDSLIYERNLLTYAGIALGSPRPQYVVYPEATENLTYKELGDTTTNNSSFWLLMSVPYAMREYTKEMVCTKIPDGGLYMTDGISKKLDSFLYVGKYRKRKEREKRLKELRKYISVSYGIFNMYPYCDYPLLLNIGIASDIVVFQLALDSNEATEIWYRKGNDRFIVLHNNRGRSIIYD